MSLDTTSRRCARFSMSQVAYLRTHYADLPVMHFAQQWGVTVKQVYGLARRHRIRRRAPNGAPEWRAPRHRLPQAA